MLAAVVIPGAQLLGRELLLGCEVGVSGLLVVNVGSPVGISPAVGQCMAHNVSATVVATVQSDHDVLVYALQVVLCHSVLDWASGGDVKLGVFLVVIVW